MSQTYSGPSFDGHGGDDTLRTIFVTGLKNAHAMENQALAIMKPQLQRIESYPDVAGRLSAHIAETEGQLTRIESVLDGLDEDTSSLKDAALSVMGSLAALGHTVAGDEIVKNSLANYAFENYEIAAYSSLIALANAGGYATAEQALQQNLQEEEAMARWLKENLAPVTLKFVSLRASGEQAKR